MAYLIYKMEPDASSPEDEDYAPSKLIGVVDLWDVAKEIVGKLEGPGHKMMIRHIASVAGISYRLTFKATIFVQPFRAGSSEYLPIIDPESCERINTTTRVTAELPGRYIVTFTAADYSHAIRVAEKHMETWVRIGDEIIKERGDRAYPIGSRTFLEWTCETEIAND